MNKALFDKYGIKRDTMLNAALSYAKRGFAVFPCAAQDKSPVTANGYQNATTDLDTVRDMFTKHPYSNIGMACGSQFGGFVVVDIDVDTEKGKDGNQSLYEWETEHGKIPETVMTLTGRGGNHYIYHSDTPCSSRIGCREGIDIRADGASIILPPSIHPNGNQYYWENDFDDFEIAEANESVIKLTKEGQAVGERFQLPTEIPQGSRNGTMHKFACSLQATGASDSTILAALREENRQRCKPPLEDSEIEQIVNSAKKYEKGTAPYEKKNHEKNETPSLTLYTYQGIVDEAVERPPFLVDELLPVCVGLLGAPPKMGKSWMALDLALQVAQGGWFLGHECNQAGVLYLALEDSLYRIKERVAKLQGNEPVPSNLYFSIAAEKINPGNQGKGLYKQLEMTLSEHNDIKLVIIDTLQMVNTPKKKTDDAYGNAYDLLNAIRPLWQDRGVGFLLIHHTRKRSINDFDPFETFLGSQGLMGASDSMYIIQSKKDADYCTFFGKGRDFDDVELSIKRNPDTCRWEVLGNGNDMKEFYARKKYEKDPIVKGLRDILARSNGVSQVFLLKDFRQQIQDDYKEVFPGNNKSLSRAIKGLSQKLMEYDGILIEALGETTYNKVTGTYFRVSRNRET